MTDGMLLDSEWNEAKAYFYRIHLAISASDDAGLRRDYQQQLLALFTLHRELSGQMKDDELSKADGLYNKASQVISLSSRHNMNQNILVKTLYEYELFLRKIMKVRKMDLPRQRDPGAALQRV